MGNRTAPRRGRRLTALRACLLLVGSAGVQAMVASAVLAAEPPSLTLEKLEVSPDHARGTLVARNPGKRDTIEGLSVAVTSRVGNEWVRSSSTTVTRPTKLGGSSIRSRASRRIVFGSTYELPAGASRVRVIAKLRLERGGTVRARRTRPLGGELVPAGEGATAHEPGGASVSIEPGTVPYPVVLGIERVDRASIHAPSKGFDLLGAYRVRLEPTELDATFPPPSDSLQVSLPLPSLAHAKDGFVLAEEVLADHLIDPKQGELAPELRASQALDEQSGKLISLKSPLPGLTTSGVYAVLGAGDSRPYGYATGTVTNAGTPVGGVILASDSSSPVATTDAAGRYSLLVRSSPFNLRAFDPLTGAQAVAGGTLPGPGGSTTVNISLDPQVSPAITRDGIRNGGFERLDLTSWLTTGSAASLSQLGGQGPTEGISMADIDTGPNAAGGVGSALRQRFIVPAGVRRLRFDYDVVTEEDSGSGSADVFRASVVTPNGSMRIVTVATDDEAAFSSVGDCGFPGGDETCAHTGWQPASIDLSDYAQPGAPTIVELRFAVADGGEDAQFDTHALLDNVRFKTLWLSPKLLAGGSSTEQVVGVDARGATEILSQAGVNVRVRPAQTIAQPGAFLDLDITWNVTCGFLGLGRCAGERTDEMKTLLDVARSATETDVNTYYPRSFTGLSACALAVGPDDYHLIEPDPRTDLLRHGGVFQVCSGGNVLAHEFGHLLVSPQLAGDPLEHNAGSTNFLFATAPQAGIVNRSQSLGINRPEAPLLAP
ncbi:MAG: hypothetical protein M3355_10515 [Actinomycetota bacterium]|nr:hypothetical protein [Actinomycetota bacterium]